MKSAIRIICFFIVCMAVVWFLYSRMHTSDLQRYDISETSISEDSNLFQKEKFPTEYIKDVSELLSFKVEVIADYELGKSSFQEAYVERQSINEEQLYSFFFQGEGDITTEYYDRYHDIHGLEMALTRFVQDTKSLNVSKYDFMFCVFPDMKYIHNAMRFEPNLVGWNENAYSIDSNLDNFSREEAWSSLVDSMESIGIDMTHSMQQAVYTMDMETLAREEICIGIDGNELSNEENPNWTEEEEGYYYYITQEHQNIPFYCYPNKIDTDYKFCAPFTIYQTRNTIKIAYLRRWFTIEIGDGKCNFIPFNEVMDVIEEKYSDIVHTNPVTVVRAKLYVYPMNCGDGLYKLEPIWVCALEEEIIDPDGTLLTNYFYIPIHAITGEELYMLEI